MPPPALSLAQLRPLLLSAITLAVPLAAGTPQSKGPRTLSSDQPDRVERGGSLFVFGHRLHPHADLKGVDFTGADLRWADLREADLRGANLTGADLSGANLAHARLESAILTGARMEGTRLSFAKTFGSQGADFSRAHLHPFFNEAQSEAVGAIRLLFGLGKLTAGGAMRDLVASPMGNLYWLKEAHGMAHLSQTGALFDSVQAGTRLTGAMLSLNLDTRQHLIVFGQNQIAAFDLAASEGPRIAPPGVSPFRAVTNRIPALRTRPSASFSTPGGTVILLWPDHGLTYHRHDDGTALVTELPALPGFTGGPLATRPDTPVVGYLDAQRHGLVLRTWGQEDFRPGQAFYPLATPDLPNLVAMGSGGRIWMARRGEDRIQCLRLHANGEATPMAITLPAGTRLHQITEGPDGCLWATDPTNEKIFRIAALGTVTAFPVPEGTRPAELLNFEHGKLLFTTLGGDAIGSIRAVASQGQGPSAAPAGPGWAAQDAALDPSQLAYLQAEADRHFKELMDDEEALLRASFAQSDAARQDLASSASAAQPQALDMETSGAPSLVSPPEPAVAKAEATSGSPAGAGPAATGPQPGKPEPSQATVSSSAQPPVAAALSPRLRLARIGVVLSDPALSHILARHRHGPASDTSHFSPAWSQPAPLQELIAAGLREAHREGTLGLIRRWDHRERSYTVCTAPEPVGTCLSRGQRLQTRRFVVVTGTYFDRRSAQAVQGVITAFPVAQDW